MRILTFMLIFLVSLITCVWNLDLWSLIYSYYEFCFYFFEFLKGKGMWVLFFQWFGKWALVLEFSGCGDGTTFSLFCLFRVLAWGFEVLSFFRVLREMGMWVCSAL